jgi:hypothetical protein
MRRIARVLVSTAIVVGVPLSLASAAPAYDKAPTSLAKEAKRFGITKAGEAYSFEEQEDNSDTLFLTVDIPTAWSDIAESRFVNPDTDERYGVGLRATTDEQKFSDTFDVPGVRVTADGLTADEIDAYDGREAVANNAYQGCRDGKVSEFDNGIYQGFYQSFDRCDGAKGHGAVVVSATDGRGVEILVSAQVLTKADLKAVDRVLRTSSVEKTSV